jgi:hypothetical protein
VGLNRVSSGDELVKVMSAYEIEDGLVERNRRDDGNCTLRESGTMNVLVARTKLLIPRSLLLAARRRGVRIVYSYSHSLEVRRRRVGVVHSLSPSVEATPKANWFLLFMFLLPFSSSGGEGVGG